MLDVQWSELIERVYPGGVLTHQKPLPGGVSGIVVELEFVLDGQVVSVVARQASGADWKTSEIDVTVEFALLSALRPTSIQIPIPLALDPGPPPTLLMERIDGTAEVKLEAALPQMARTLAQLHRLDVEDLGLPALRERVVEGCERVLLHGDFWWGNLLWKNDQLVGVIDWEDAAVGDPNSDLAGAGIEILWTHGQEAMERFFALYLAEHPIDTASLRHWQVYVGKAALASMQHWGLPPEKEARMRRRTETLL